MGTKKYFTKDEVFTRAQLRHRKGDGWTPRKVRRLINKRTRKEFDTGQSRLSLDRPDSKSKGH